MSDIDLILGGNAFDLNEISKAFEDIKKGQPWSEFKKIEFIDKKFDFEIDPDHFIKWLDAEKQEIYYDNYSLSVCGACEYSCLYIAMLLNGLKLRNKIKIYYGKFGFWEHYWIGYEYEEQEYFIDLTLQQFIKDAPKLSISKANNDKDGYNYIENNYELAEDYIDRQRAFEFYINPKEV